MSIIDKIIKRYGRHLGQSFKDKRAEFKKGAYAHKDTLSYLRNLENVVEVLWDFYEISEDPLVSFGYENCRAVITQTIEGNNKSGLSHIFPDELFCNQYQLRCIMGSMINDLNREPKSLSALVVARHPQYEIERILSDFGIKHQTYYQLSSNSPNNYAEPHYA